MKKFLILLTLLCTNIGSAQTVDGLFDLNNPALMQDSVSAKYTGQPVILIEKPSEEKKEAPNPAMLIPPPEFSRYHPKLKIKTPFGHDWTADFIEQITDRVFVVQIFDNKTIQVEEQIQFVTTDKNKQIEHVIPKIITDEQGKEFSVDVQVLSFSSDTDKIHPTITDSETEIKIAFDVNNVGLHTIMAKYLFKNVIQKNNSLAKVFFSLTGEGYPKMTERFSVWVLFPDKKVSFYKAELLFGKNNQSVKDNFIFLTDENNNLLLKTTRPLPAYTDVRLNLVLDAKKIPVSQRNIFDFNNEIILGIYILVLAFYVLISIYECRYSKIKLKLKKCVKINTKVLFSILSGESKSLSVIIKALFLFCLEYIFGILFLILSLFFILNFKNQVISVGVVLIVIIFGISAVGFIYQYGVKHKLFRIKQYIRGLLLETPFGINPPVHKIKDYYELAQKWKIEKEWKKIVLKNNPSYQDKDFER